ncbi:PHD finger protein 20 isoform X2 [Brachyhypopomus gauderio]|uniref:PHD finger protein 20 isoform X2 n=1 Tax=Brachyhypopomus gauderio TaxID=698409 RepID=UPI00404328F6
MEHSRKSNSMSKTPPNRRGITFEVGAAVEACDSLKNWYAANIEKIDYEDEKVLIHYRQWSHRYDEWFDWASPYLRPVERVQLRRERLQDGCSLPGFHVNEKVLASWSDCRFYPAKVLAVHKDASYTVKFYDGFIQTVKGMHVKPFIKERVRQKSQTFDRNGEKNPFKMTKKHSRQQEGVSHKSKPGSQHDCGPESESDSDSTDERAQGKREKAPGQDRAGACKADRVGMPEGDGPERGECPAGHMGQHNYSKSFAKTSVHREEGGDGRAGVERGTCSALDDGTENGEPETELPEQKEEENGPLQSRTAQGLSGKRRCLVGQSDMSFKKIKTETFSDKCEHGESRLSSEMSKQTLSENGLECDPIPSTQAQSSNGTAALRTEGQSEASKHLPSPPAKPARKQGFHNPKRFSREPLYRVIKNQPPPVLSINLDHNPFKCNIPGCSKSFRKAKLLHYHMKYYHGDEWPPTEAPGASGGVHTRAANKQTPPTSWQSSKRRRSMTLSLREHLGLDAAAHGDALSAPPPRAEGWSVAQMAERKQTLAPPAVSMHQLQALPKEKSREKQQDRNRGVVDKDRKSAVETVCVKDRDRSKEKKSRAFLRIKLKKKKKKKSKSGSEENIDISVFGPQSKLSLSPKPVPSHAHPAEAFQHSRGRGQAQHMQTDDEASVSDWSSDSYGWSDDETGMDVDLTTTPLSCGSVDSATVAQETVRCVCEVAEENDFMIQCEVCLCWQHRACMGLLVDTTPDAYACFICREPSGQRLSLRYWCDQDWLNSGRMFGFSFLEENYSHQNARKIVATHQLLGDVHHVLEVLNSLQLKINILQNEAHPDLKLWNSPWQQVGGRARRVFTMAPSTTHSPSSSSSDEGLHRSRSATKWLHREASSSSSSSSSFHNYISSEHCYQKPRACYTVLGRSLEAEMGGGSEPEDSPRGSEPGDSPRGSQNFLHYEQHNGEEPHPLQFRGSKDGGEELMGGSRQQQRINLLEHIECVQDEVMHRMDSIERELDVLESWLDYSGELEPPEPLSRLPELKHSIKQLLGDLGKMQQIAVACAT